MKRFAIAIILAACGSGRTTGTMSSGGAGPPPPPGPKTDGTEGAVCGWGHRNTERHDAPAACQAGLQCCYPCGIDGCDSVCEAVTDCPELP